jgi:hypothetical protein
MRHFTLICAIVVFAFGCSKSENAVDYRQPISAAVQSLKGELASTNYIVLIQHPATHSLFLSTPGWTNVDQPKSLQNFANDLRKVDITQCPEDFRLAWFNVIHTIENYQITPNVGHGLASGAATAVALRSGSSLAGDLAAREFEEITTQSDIKKSVQDLETVCLKYDVQPTQLRPTPPSN